MASMTATVGQSASDITQPALNPATLVQWSGAATIVGALLILQAPIFHPDDGPEALVSPLWVPNHFALYVGYALIQLGLIGILIRQIRHAGRLGVLGFVIAFLGAAFTLMEGRDHTFSLPVMQLAGLQSSNPDELTGLWSLILNAALFSVGHILLGVATFRATVLPRAAAVLMATGAPVLAFSPPIPLEAVALVGSFLYSSGMIWLGWSLLATRQGKQVTSSQAWPAAAAHSSAPA